MIGGSDIASDFDIFDDTETVIVYCRNSDGSTTTNTSVSALRRPLDRQDANLAGVFSAGDACVFHIQESDLTSATIRTGDTVKDTGLISWKVISVRLESWETRFRLVCNRQRA